MTRTDWALAAYHAAQFAVVAAFFITAGKVLLPW